MDFILTILGIVVVGWIGMFIVGSIKVVDTSKKKKNILSELEKLNDFKASQQIIGSEGESALAIDKTRDKFCLIKQKDGIISSKIYTYKDILETEILEDGLSVTKTARGSQLGGTLIGGLALGGVGAIIGGLSCKKNQIDKVSNIDLKIIVNDMESPMFLLNFLKFPEGCKKDSFSYKTSIESAREWNSLLTVLIKKADEEDNSNIDNKENNISVADEIIKLKKLLDDGLLSEKEFEQEKNKLLK